MICKHKSIKLNTSKYCYISLAIQLNLNHLFTQIVLFLTIQFSLRHSFTHFKYQTVLFDQQIGPYQVLPLQDRVDLGAKAMKGYSIFPKAPALLEPHHQIVLCHILGTYWGGSYLSAEMLLVYSAAPFDWVHSRVSLKFCNILVICGTIP